MLPTVRSGHIVTSRLSGVLFVVPPSGGWRRQVARRLKAVLQTTNPAAWREGGSHANVGNAAVRCSRLCDPPGPTWTGRGESTDQAQAAQHPLHLHRRPVLPHPELLSRSLSLGADAEHRPPG